MRWSTLVALAGSTVDINNDGLIAIRPTDNKGFGAFASTPIAEGVLVCRYEGEMLTKAEVDERYPPGATTTSEYLFELLPPRRGVRDGLYVDGVDSAHASRYINHDEHGNLVPMIGATASVQPGGAPRSLCWRGPVLKLRSTSGVAALDNGDSSSSSSSQIEFYAARAISEGEGVLGGAGRGSVARLRFAAAIDPRQARAAMVGAGAHGAAKRVAAMMELCVRCLPLLL